VYGGLGDTIASASGTNVVFTGGSNPITVTSTAGSVVVSSAAGDTLTGGTAPTQFIGAAGDSITLGSGNDTVNALAGNESVTLGGGHSIVFGGTGDTITAGGGTGDIILQGANHTFVDSSNVYADTLTGFSQPGGDRIHLTTDTVGDALANSQLVNGGHDTLITLSDHSTILLKGITNLDSTFFN
jgi:Ca2+-binding RTX toxin-like protein